MQRWMTLSVFTAMLLAVALVNGCSKRVEPFQLDNFQVIAVSPFSTEKAPFKIF